jgi:hypothetical protein
MKGCSEAVPGATKPHPKEEHIGPIDPDASTLKSDSTFWIRAPMLKIVLEKCHAGQYRLDCALFAPETPKKIPKPPPSTTWIMVVSPGERTANQRRFDQPAASILPALMDGAGGCRYGLM